MRLEHPPEGSPAPVIATFPQGLLDPAQQVIGQYRYPNVPLHPRPGLMVVGTQPVVIGRLSAVVIFRDWAESGTWGFLTSDVPSPICDTAVTRL